MTPAESSADLAQMRATMSMLERQLRVGEAVAAFRRALHGIATVEVAMPQSSVLVLTVRGTEGEPVAVIVNRPGCPAEPLNLGKAW